MFDDVGMIFIDGPFQGSLLVKPPVIEGIVNKCLNHRCMQTTCSNVTVTHCQTSLACLRLGLCLAAAAAATGRRPRSWGRRSPQAAPRRRTEQQTSLRKLSMVNFATPPHPPCCLYFTRGKLMVLGDFEILNLKIVPLPLLRWFKIQYARLTGQDNLMIWWRNFADLLKSPFLSSTTSSSLLSPSWWLGTVKLKLSSHTGSRLEAALSVFRRRGRSGCRRIFTKGSGSSDWSSGHTH